MVTAGLPGTYMDSGLKYMPMKSEAPTKLECSQMLPDLISGFLSSALLRNIASLHSCVRAWSYEWEVGSHSPS